MSHAVAEALASDLRFKVGTPAALRLAADLERKAKEACPCGACSGWDMLHDLDSLLGDDHED